MTPERIEELKKLCAKATPGPWTSDSTRLLDGSVAHTCPEHSGYCISSAEYRIAHGFFGADEAELCAASRSAVPELITEIEKLRRQLRIVMEYINNSALDQLLFIDGKILDFFNGDDAKVDLWWHTPNYMLGDLTPEGMILRGHIDKLVQFVLHSLEENEEPK